MNYIIEGSRGLFLLNYIILYTIYYILLYIFCMDDNMRLNYIRGNGTGDLVDNFTHSTEHIQQLRYSLVDAAVVDIIVFI